MAGISSGKEKRHAVLKELLLKDPFLTDGELARKLQVSVPTIRLDRMNLNIPELRERILSVAAGAKQESSEILDIDLGVNGTSLMNTSKEMCFPESDIVRSCHLYDMAERLAAAILNIPCVLVDVANIKYRIPVYCNTKLVSRGEVKSARKGNTYVVWIKTYGNQTEVFRGKFILEAI